MRRRRRTPRSIASLSAIVFFAGCAPSRDLRDIGEQRERTQDRDDDDGAIAEGSQSIIGGEASTPEQDAAVLVLHSGVDTFEICSGTMLTPRLVLTARHCLASASSTVRCSAKGLP